MDGFKIGNVNINSRLILAPMAGYTNSVYRNICGECGAGLVYTEMISDKGLLYDNDRTLQMASGKNDNFPLAVQIFGGNISEMVEASKIVSSSCDCDIIDINMGCPVRKVIKAFSGSYLLQDIEYASKMVSEIKKVIDKPLTVKIRMGWDHNSINCVEMAKALEKAGADAIAIHGRCKSDMYSGKVDWDAIKSVKEAVKIPLIGNGDIKNGEDVKKFLAYTGCDGAMIGRASYGNPWIFKEMTCALEGKEYIASSIEERITTLKRHINELIELKGEKIAVLEMRTIAMWYVKGLQNLKEFKANVVSVKTKEELLNCIDTLIEKNGGL
jgi:nifR3 family TIM-barrel protein